MTRLYRAVSIGEHLRSPVMTMSVAERLPVVTCDAKWPTIAEATVEFLTTVT